MTGRLAAGLTGRLSIKAADTQYTSAAGVFTPDSRLDGGAFTPGSASATGLNREIQQVFANIIWSPFGQVRNGVFGSGWLDVGMEYVFTRRDIQGGATAAGAGQVGHGIGNRFLFATIARF